MGDIISSYLDSLPDKKGEDIFDNAFSELMERIRTNTESNVHNIERNVHHPKHYGGADNVYEAIKVIEAQGIGNEFCLGNCLKYLLRAGKKTESPLEDYKKAKWYLERLITNIENNGR
jgi:hypothetical protein